MKNRKNKMLNSITAFTLIELLIAVLIIGILAAVAIPQYQQAVLKSRYKTLMLPAKTIHSGNEVYFVANGFYADKLTDLDVDIPQAVENIQVQLSDNEEHAYVLASRDDIDNNYIMYQKYSINYPGEIHCEARTDNAQANRLCQLLGGTPILGGSLTENYTEYVLEGSGQGFPPGVNEAMEKERIACSEARELGYTCTLTKNKNGQDVKQICSPLGVCRSYTSNADGGYTSITCKANEEGICTSDYQSITYDSQGKVTAQRTCETVASDGSCSKYVTSGPYGSYDYKYEYDKQGRETLKTSLQCMSVAEDGKCTYGSASYSITRYNPDGSIQLKANTSCSSGALSATEGTCSYYSGGSTTFYNDEGTKVRYEECSSNSSSFNMSTAKCNSPTLVNKYDNQGRELSHQSDDQRFSYTIKYEDDGNVTIRTKTCSSSTSQYCKSEKTRTEYEYASNGKVASATSCSAASDGTCTGSQSRTSYSYNTQGNVTSEISCTLNSDGSCSYQSGKRTFYEYDDNGNLKSSVSCSMMKENGTCDSGWALLSSYDNYSPVRTYDADGRVLMERSCASLAADNTCARYTGRTIVYSYDEVGKLLSTQYCNSGNINPTTGECSTYTNVSTKQ